MMKESRGWTAETKLKGFGHMAKIVASEKKGQS